MACATATNGDELILNKKLRVDLASEGVKCKSQICMTKTSATFPREAWDRGGGEDPCKMRLRAREVPGPAFKRWGPIMSR